MSAAPDTRPLADRMRPRSVAEFIGQEHLLADGKPLRRAVEGRHLHSMIFWGPPGTGKTTLARIIASTCDAEFIALSAVMAGVRDVRSAVDQARMTRSGSGRATVLFLDEVHRFNKAQQDAFLPFVEDGTLTFIGATTENPSFELNNALLSRARVYVLKSLTAADLEQVLQAALDDAERGLGNRGLGLDDRHRALLAEAADGDARRALNLLEIAADLSEGEVIDEQAVAEALAGGYRRFDKGGEAFYDQISALHKTIRNSHPDAALYWLSRMLDGGCDPVYLARRLVRIASEDVGNADPRALPLALAAWETYDRLGSPEGELALAQAAVYLAVAPKSNAVYAAFNEAWSDAQKHGSREVPVHLRNAPTKLMKELGYGHEYRYAHDAPDAFVPGDHGFPDAMGPKAYYHPAPRGLEQRIGEKLAEWRRRDQEALKGTGRRQKGQGT